MKNKIKSLDDLEKGIKHLLSEDRCSFSDKEKVLLGECISSLKRAKGNKKKSGITDFKLLSDVVEILLTLMIIAEHIKDVF